MESYILTDRGLCIVRDGSWQWRLFDEVKKEDFLGSKNVALLLGNVEYRQERMKDGKDTPGAVFPGGFIVRQERLKGGISVLMGAREEALQWAYELFPKGSIRICVPYGMAVRSSLLSQGVALESAAYIVVNDAGERVFMTVLDGMGIIETRELVFQDGERLAEEVRRSEKRLLERTKHRSLVKILSDHQAFLSESVQQGRTADIFRSGDSDPLLDVLQKAKFGVHFSSPLEEVARKRRETRQRLAVQYSLPALILIGVLCFVMAMSMMASEVMKRTEGLSAEERRLHEAINDLTARTYQQRVRFGHPISWEGSFSDLLSSLPNGWKIHDVVWSGTMDGEGVISALVVKGEDGVLDGRGILKEATVTNELYAGFPAVRIVYRRGSVSI
ncbi:MAG: hypothetical protein HQL19_01045 [Candidatus Omnitrophica bacterium]|nr:hypothetical protein [Candidatus Omnitrophota bacterium]